MAIRWIRNWTKYEQENLKIWETILASVKTKTEGKI